MIALRQLTEGTPYAAYTYSYPHKTAYRRLDPPRALRQVWAPEAKDSLFLYIHVPFCEMRCGFCNLFTTANPHEEVTQAYLGALARQGRQVRDAIGPAGRFARMAIGGGTPTYLSAGQLDAIFTLAHELFGVDGREVPISVETSPRTADLDKLCVLRAHGVRRVSIGVQSFMDEEVNASGRAQKEAWVHAAIDRIRELNFATLNLDLIYGLPGQTVASWVRSLETALRREPRELYLYPLYVRPLTGLGRKGEGADDDLRLECYRRGREVLISAGYEQVSMRMFRRPVGEGEIEPVYCCQDDGMVGLGCGARSYTRALHYSGEYAVGASGVREIIGDYLVRPDSAFEAADYGCELDEPEQKRRWVIKSLLRAGGLCLRAYRERFGSEAQCDVPELDELEQAGLTELDGDALRPTELGLERSDAIGPYLFSAAMRERMEAYELR
jgi:oxygen-independent coproporphyrinogen-3 oxidase